MNKQIFSTLVLFVACVLALAGCAAAGDVVEPAANVGEPAVQTGAASQAVTAGPAQEEQPCEPIVTAPLAVEAAPVQVTADETAEALDSLSPLRVTKRFYAWYLACHRDEEGERRSPLGDKAYRESPYLTAALVARVDALLESFVQQDMGGYDPFLMAQNIPADYTFEALSVEDGQARTLVYLAFAGPAHVLTVDLVQEESGWKIDSIRDGDPRSPDGVVKLFYSEYLDMRREEGSPLGSRTYRTSEWLSPDFIARVDETLAGFEQRQEPGADPFLLAQDLPQWFVVEPAALQGDEARLELKLYWSGSDPTVREVTLRKIDDRWLIEAVTAK